MFHNYSDSRTRSANAATQEKKNSNERLGKYTRVGEMEHMRVDPSIRLSTLSGGSRIVDILMSVLFRLRWGTRSPKLDPVATDKLNSLTATGSERRRESTLVWIAARRVSAAGILMCVFC